jgi:hypothetical protein
MTLDDIVTGIGISKKYTKRCSAKFAWWNKGCSICMCNIFPIVFDGDYKNLSESAAYFPGEDELCR